MRIAFVSQARDFISGSGIQRGSVAIVTWELARRLALRHDVVIYAPQGAGEPMEELAADRLLVRRIGGTYRRLHRSLELALGMIRPRTPYFTHPMCFREYGAAAARWLARDPPDCVHVQVAPQLVPLIRHALPNAFVVLHAHDALAPQVHSSHVERCVSAARAVVTCSDFVTARWRDRFPRIAPHVTTLGNGVDLERFRPAETTGGTSTNRPSHEILFVGRVSPEKGVHVLADAFAQVLHSFPDSQLSLAGSPGLLPLDCIWPLAGDPYVASLREFYGTSLAAQLRKQLLQARSSYLRSVMARIPASARTRARVLGAVDYDRVPALYRGAGVLAAPSVWDEPFGLPVVEALASGLPVVVSRSGAMPDLIDEGVTGCIVDRGDASALAETICELFSNSKRLQQMSVDARLAAMQRHGWDDVVKRLESVYAGA